jgi:ABC-2 type transport system permease protein
VSVLWLFLDREWRDLRGNSRVLPLFVILPLLGIVVPAGLALAAPEMIALGAAKNDPGIALMSRMVRTVPEFAAYPLAEAIARYLVRNSCAILLLLPVAISSSSAAFSIVGEKQQRTLEPILATPISDRQFLLGKLLAALVPTMAATWIAAAVGAVLVDLLSWGRYPTPLLPDRFWLIGVLVLAPLLGACVVLVTMRLSARATDPQAVVQTTALVTIPGFLLLGAIFGKAVTLFFPALLGACLFMFVVVAVLFRGNVRTFRREEILTRWK